MMKTVVVTRSSTCSVTICPATNYSTSYKKIITFVFRCFKKRCHIFLVSAKKMNIFCFCVFVWTSRDILGTSFWAVEDVTVISFYHFLTSDIVKQTAEPLFHQMNFRLTDRSGMNPLTEWHQRVVWRLTDLFVIWCYLFCKSIMLRLMHLFLNF